LKWIFRIENYEDDALESDASSIDVEELRGTIEDEVKGVTNLLSTSWAEGLSIKSIGYAEEADDFFGKQKREAFDSVCR
jgi:hypothetical protein